MCLYSFANFHITQRCFHLKSVFAHLPPMWWVFDTPDDPFEQYLVSKMPDAYEKYVTTKNFDELCQ